MNMGERFGGSMQHIQSSSCPICELRAQQQAEKGCPVCALRNQQPNRTELYAGLVEAAEKVVNDMSETSLTNLKTALGRVKG